MVTAALAARIDRNPDVMVGKPVVRGTRIPVDLVLRHLTDTASINDVLEAFPRLAIDDIRACIDYARDAIAAETV